MSWIRRALEQAERRPRRALALVIALALAVHAPSLLWGFFSDDFVHQLVLRGEELGRMRPWSLYDFGELGPPGSQAFEQAGYPWWSSPDWKVRFFRPLSSLALWLDRAAFGEWTVGWHLSSLGWYALALVLVHALYRALGLSGGRALLALLVFALEDGSAIPVGWVANRNSLLALVFEVAAVLTIVRGPRPTTSGRLVLALVFALGAALCKESGLAAFGLIALGLMWSAGGAAAAAKSARTWIGVAAALALALAYLAFLIGSGYGARSLFYPTPWSEPALFLRRLCLLLPGSVPSLCGPLPLDAAFLQPERWPLFLGAASVAALAISAASWKPLRASRTTWFWLGWWILTLLPQAGAPSSDRLLFSSSVASSALISELVAATVGRARAAGAVRGGGRLFGLALLLSSTLASGLALLGGQFFVGALGQQAREAALEAEVGSPSLGRREVFLLQAPSGLAALSPGATWASERADRELRFWVLQQGRRGLRWTRPDERSFELESLDRAFLDHPFEDVFLSSSPRVRVGDTWRTALFEVEATRVDEYGLRAFRVRCPESLDVPRYRFLVWRAGRWVHQAPPPIGAELVLPELEAALPGMP